MKSVQVTKTVNRCVDCPEFIRGSNIGDLCNIFGGWHDYIPMEISSITIDDRCPLLKEQNV